MTHHDQTLIDRLAGIVKDSPVDRAFRMRAEARAEVEASYRRLLHPEVPGAMTLAERRAVAAFVAVLHGEETTRSHFIDLLRQTEPHLVPLIVAEAEGASYPGPYGAFPSGPLSAEDLVGPVYRAGPLILQATGPRLAAALDHAHLLALHPRDASPASLRKLAEAGWTAEGAVLLSQLVSFLGFQIRVVAGLRSFIAARHPAAATLH